DWYWHMPLALGLTDLAMASGDVNLARIRSQEFLRVVEETEERTWKALAWDASARHGSSAERAVGRRYRSRPASGTWCVRDSLACRFTRRKYAPASVLSLITNGLLFS
ncbi:MAG: hypothetical protein ACRD7E_02095, partial [Bryobacteraceae bacterium]